MRRRIAIIVVSALLLPVGTACPPAEDPFSRLDEIGGHHVGREGLETLLAEATVSSFPGSLVKVYWSRKLGLYVKAKRARAPDEPAVPWVWGHVRLAGLEMENPNEAYGLTRETVEATVQRGTLEDGTRVKVLLFHPKEGQELGFVKLTLKLDSETSQLRQVVSTRPEGEAISHLTYEGNLMKRLVISTPELTRTITNTYQEKDGFAFPAEQVIEAQGEGIAKDKERVVISYSKLQVNAEIPRDVLAELEELHVVPKPTESVSELLDQANAALARLDVETGKLKLRQVIKYYPEDPRAGMARGTLNSMKK